MHREIRKLLKDARGASRFVAVVFVDIRGFSKFAKSVESSESALFLRAAYTRILDRYFDDATFFKPTGDGLLIVLDYSDESLQQVIERAVATSVRLVEEFPTLCSDDPMINFAVPNDIGIGIARGAATCLMSGDKTIDYSGRPLNLAARLMDIARPRGVVFEGSLGTHLVPEDVIVRFAEEEVYVKGIAEDEPMRVFVLEDVVSVPSFNKRPLNQLRAVVEPKKVFTFKELQDRGLFKTFFEELSEHPVESEDIKVLIEHPKAMANGRPHKSLFTYRTYDAKHASRGGVPFAEVAYPLICTELANAGVKATWKINVRIEYFTRAP